MPKRKNVTERIIKHIIKQWRIINHELKAMNKHEMPFNDILNCIIVRDWVGFEAEWIIRDCRTKQFVKADQNRPDWLHPEIIVKEQKPLTPEQRAEFDNDVKDIDF